MKYFKTSEEIRRLIEEKHKKNSFKEIDKTPIPIMHDLDGFFEKKINGILLSKCKNRSIIDVQKTFIELQKDEDFDKKEFDFSKKMLRHKKSYSMGKIISKFLINMKEKDGLGYSRPRGELRNEIKEISTQNRIKSKVDKTKTDKEDEKTINFSLQLCRRSSIMPFDPNEETFGQIPMKDSIIRLNSREKLQNTLIKNKVTFGSKEIADKQGIKDKRRETRSMSIYRRFKNDENKDEDYHKHTKEMIQKMAENIVKDLEKCDKNIEELKINKDFAEKQKKRKEKEINAKKGRITKMNGELSRSVKNFSMRREILENSQNQVLFSVGLKKMVKKKTNIMQPVSLMKL